MSFFDDPKYGAVKAEVQAVMTKLHALVMEGAQHAGVLSDPVDAVSTMLIVMAVGMLRGYRPEESEEALHERLTSAVAQGLSASAEVVK